MKKVSAKRNSTVQALDRALTLYRRLAAKGDQPQSLSELTDYLGMDQSSVFRILNTFAQHGMVRYDEKDRVFLMGTENFRFAAVAARQNPMRDLVRPALKGLVEAFGETAHLALLSGDRAVFVESLGGTRPVTIHHDVGHSVELHCTAVGKSLLMDHTDGELRTLFPAGRMEKFTPQTATSVQELLKRLEKHRAEGYSVDDEERDTGVYCLAAPIRNYQGRITGAIGISGVTSRLRPRRHEVAEQVLSHARLISAELGHRP